MLEVNVQTDVKQALRGLDKIQRQAVPLATAKALTFTAERAQKKITDLIPQVFSNPTPFTRRAVYKTSATPSNLESSVFLKDLSATGVRLGGDHYLLPQIKGGSRPQGRFEQRLGGYWVPGRDAKRNKYGNLPRGTWSKMLADVGALGQHLGDASNTKRGALYFMRIGKSGRRIIFKRVGGSITPWAVEVSKPRYNRRWPFFKVIHATVASQFRRLFDKSLARELARVKP